MLMVHLHIGCPPLQKDKAKRSLSPIMPRAGMRPLGSVRKYDFNDTVPKLPNVKATVNQNGEPNLTGGIHGNAMTVPPKSPEKEPEKIIVNNNRKAPSPRRPITSKSDESNKSDDSIDKKKIKVVQEKSDKELKDALAKEKSLKQKVSSLQKIIDELKNDVATKDQIIEHNTNTHANEITNYKDLLEKEKTSHAETKKKLSTSKLTVTERDATIAKLREENAKQLEELRTKLSEDVQAVKDEMDKEIAVRETKLAKMKRQIADALMGNSQERQQQLEELTKELSRLQEEADMLRAKLKQKSKSNGPCPNCDELTKERDSINKVAKSKDETIKELNSLCAKFEKQLIQQDELLKTWVEKEEKKMKK
ncbi:unnamed protein product [Owenia fusiformis]|uniref:Uncharacterized protein n=1 Tax=Owenia fusiformis TaxID=6347 RepID=A0A8S4Q5Y2_OWEFU|nr:unnamed protein product [Owenia fusiformis]